MRVLIGCPTYYRYEYCIDEYLAAVRKLSFQDYDLIVVDNSKDDTYFKKLQQKGVTVIKGPYVESAKERIVLSREILRRKCIEDGYDYFFSLEQDVIVKPDTLTRLLSHKLPIVSAYYGNNTPFTVKNQKTGEIKKIIINIPIVYWETRPGFIKRANAHEVINKGVIEVGMVGVGCVLISREVLMKINFRLNSGAGFDDFLFCEDAKKLNYSINLDSDLILEHRHVDWNANLRK